MSYNKQTLALPPLVPSVVPYPSLGMVPVEAYGADGDAIALTDGAITSGLHALTSPGNHFVSFTGSKAVVVNNAGPLVNGLPTDLVTTATFVSTGQLTTAGAAGATVSGATVHVGTDNTTTIQDALNDTNAPFLTLMGGLYLCSGGLTLPSGKTLFGAGDTENATGKRIGIVSAGSLYSHQADIPTDPIAGVGGSISVTSATQSGHTATYLLAGAIPAWLVAGYLGTGSVVTVSGMLAAGYNFTGTVLAVDAGAHTFDMLVPTSGLSNSTQGGTCTSQAGKRYAMIGADTGNGKSDIHGLGIYACNNLTTVAWGVLWPNTGSAGPWEYHLHSCNLQGWVGRHLMWGNGTTYDGGNDIGGYWAADAFTIPLGLSFKNNVQKVTDVGTTMYQSDGNFQHFGRIHYEFLGDPDNTLLSCWAFVGGTMEAGYGLGDFVGVDYTTISTHLEVFTAPSDLFVNIPATAGSSWINPQFNTTSPQANIMLAALGFSGGGGGSSWGIVNGGAAFRYAQLYQLFVTTMTPASHTAAGSIGQITWDSDYIYVCINTNTWRRVAITSW